jgi:hypothetical protein
LPGGFSTAMTPTPSGLVRLTGSPIRADSERLRIGSLAPEVTIFRIA